MRRADLVVLFDGTDNRPMGRYLTPPQADPPFRDDVPLVRDRTPVVVRMPIPIVMKPPRRARACFADWRGGRRFR